MMRSMVILKMWWNYILILYREKHQHKTRITREQIIYKWPIWHAEKSHIRKHDSLKAQNTQIDFNVRKLIDKASDSTLQITSKILKLILSYVKTIAIIIWKSYSSTHPFYLHMSVRLDFLYIIQSKHITEVEHWNRHENLDIFY